MSIVKQLNEMHDHKDKVVIYYLKKLNGMHEKLNEVTSIIQLTSNKFIEYLATPPTTEKKINI